MDRDCQQSRTGRREAEKLEMRCNSMHGNAGGWQRLLPINSKNEEWKYSVGRTGSQLPRPACTRTMTTSWSIANED